MNKRTALNSSFSLFGYPLSSPIGMAACPISTVDYIKKIAENGYDIITYKTIRAEYSPPLETPNEFFVHCARQLSKQDVHATFYAADQAHEQTLCLTNSYGNNSPDPDTVVEQLQKTRISLHEGQVLVVSIYGKGSTTQEQITDFVAAAQLAQKGGAMVIEANISCPNIDKEGLLYHDPVLVQQLCTAITQTVTLPLTIKVGICENNELLRHVILAAYNGGARGICGINTMPVKVINAQGQPVFGAERKISGLSGAPLFSLALDFARGARTIVTQEQIPFIIFATGGVIKPEQFDQLLAAGADIVQTATGAIFNQQLAQEYHAMHNTLCSPEKQQLIKQLHTIGALQIKNIQLKSGAISPIYFDMRLVMSKPTLLRTIAQQIWNIVTRVNYDLICGVPHAAVPLATALSLETDCPLIMQRKEAKTHGNKKMIEGAYQPAATCLVIEDVITTGGSILECIKVLEHEGGLVVKDIAIVIDREQGGIESLTTHGYRVHSLITMQDILHVLLNEAIITDKEYDTIKEFCVESKNNFLNPSSTKQLSM